MKKAILIGLVAVVVLAVAGIAADAHFKGQAKSEFAAVVERYDRTASADDAAKLSASIDGVQQVVAAAAGRIKGKGWSDADRRSFTNTATARVDRLVSLMCTKSVDGKTVHGQEIRRINLDLREGLSQMHNAASGKGAALDKIGAAFHSVRAFTSDKPCQ